MRIVLGTLTILLLTAPNVANAVVPPEFIVQITSQIVPIFGMVFAGLLAAFGVIYNFFGSFFKNKYVIIAITIFGIGAISWGIAYGVDEIRKQGQAQEVQHQISFQEEQYETDRETKIIETVVEEVAADIDEDPGAHFIRTYYRYISDGKFLEAYRMTRQAVTFDTFYSWYKETTHIDIEKLESTGENVYSVRVVLYEGTTAITFGVLATLELDEAGEVYSLGSTEVVVLGNGVVQDHVEDTYAIDNASFQDLLDQGAEPFVLDARELIEYEYGHFPGSIHSKFADLEDGAWRDLPNDTKVYVLCWSGIRGSMVVSFLRDMGVDAYYIKDGAKSWVEDGGMWEGEISFEAVYTQDKYKVVFTPDQFDMFQEEGAFLVDSRQPEKFEKSHIDGSLNVRIMYTPTRMLDKVLESVPPESTIIALCDDYVNCFDSRLVGIELERRGHTFLGRYIYVGS